YRRPLYASRSVRHREGPPALHSEKHFGNHWKPIQYWHSSRSEAGLDVRLHARATRDDREGAEAEGYLREARRSAGGGGDSVSLRSSGRRSGSHWRAFRR